MSRVKKVVSDLSYCEQSVETLALHCSLSSINKLTFLWVLNKLHLPPEAYLLQRLWTWRIC